MSTIDKDLIKVMIIILSLILVLVIGLFVYLSINSGNTQTNNPNIIASLQSSSKQDENEEVENKIEIKEENSKVVTQSLEVIRLTNSGWDLLDTMIDGEYEVQGNNHIYEKFTVTRNDSKITRIVFNTKYEDEIITGIKVGMSAKEVKKALGTPNFINDDLGMLGYKADNIYLCIYENEIAVYENKYCLNDDLSDSILEFYNGEYDGDKNDFFRYIQKNYSDFSFKMTEDAKIIMTSMLRGINIEVGDDIKVKLYKNYIEPENLINNMGEDSLEYINQNTVELIEVERKAEE